mmetsp:Transcript_83744/g.224060  ORF Transcript_83744/g.224060 Transcript_83744/m.224060 type:complete len:251 (+) Transcript_83744:4262-5014(+)
MPWTSLVLRSWRRLASAAYFSFCATARSRSRWSSATCDLSTSTSGDTRRATLPAPSSVPPASLAVRDPGPPVVCWSRFLKCRSDCSRSCRSASSSWDCWPSEAAISCSRSRIRLPAATASASQRSAAASACCLSNSVEARVLRRVCTAADSLSLCACVGRASTTSASSCFTLFCAASSFSCTSCSAATWRSSAWAVALCRALITELCSSCLSSCWLFMSSITCDNSLLAFASLSARTRASSSPSRCASAC